jgi:hypothetical protein
MKLFSSARCDKNATSHATEIRCRVPNLVASNTPKHRHEWHRDPTGGSHPARVVCREGTTPVSFLRPTRRSAIRCRASHWPRVQGRLGKTVACGPDARFARSAQVVAVAHIACSTRIARKEGIALQLTQALQITRSPKRQWTSSFRRSTRGWFRSSLPPCRHMACAP